MFDGSVKPVSLIMSETALLPTVPLAALVFSVAPVLFAVTLNAGKAENAAALTLEQEAH